MSTTTATRIFIPTPLRPYADDAGTLDVEGATVGDALDALTTAYPALRPHLYDEQGRLRSFVNIFRNDEDIRHLDREATPLRAGDDLSIVPSVAGGR